MSENQNIVADPWLKKARKASLPADVRFACAYDLNFGPDSIEEASFFRRNDGRDELWIVAGISLPAIAGIVDGTVSPQDVKGLAGSGIGCVFAVFAKGDESSACLSLLERLFYARLIQYWPEKFLVGGIVDESAYGVLVARIEQELKENSERAQEKETEIIRVARELGLGPQPTGTGPNFWQARCPETNHVIYISAAENEFGCGWCCRKGSPDDLRAFVRERKERRASSGNGRS